MGYRGVEEGVGDVTIRWIIYICIGTALMVGYCLFFILSNDGGQDNIRNLRVNYAEAVANAENGEYKKLEKYECAVIGIDTRVTYTNSTLYKLGESVNLHVLSTGTSKKSNMVTKQFISPLIGENGQCGTLVIMVSETPKVWSTRIVLQILLPFIGGAYIIYCGVRLQKYIRKKIVEPVNSMSDVAEEILRGNYQKVINCDNVNEVGKLFEKMELLRDELQNISIQAQKFYENEKVMLVCISHDLKTPIATISGCAEAIKGGIAKTTSDLEHYTNIILNKSKLLTKLINEILEHTNSELEEISLKKQEIYARDFIKDVYMKLLPDVQAKKIEFKMNEIPDLLLYIEPEYIFRVFQNVIENSVKYTQEGGIIHIKFEEFNNGLAVEIEDNGQGISALDIPFIFDRFYRGEKARTQKDVSGSGLGLSIVRNIIEQHGGRLECDSVLGQGTAIRFFIPIA